MEEAKYKLSDYIFICLWRHMKPLWQWPPRQYKTFVCERNMENGEESGGYGELADVGPLAAVFGEAVWPDLEHVEKAVLQASHPTNKADIIP